MSGQRLGNIKHSLGFTLVEVMVTMALMGVAILSIMGLISAGMRVDQTSNNNSEATVIAKGLIEDMLNSDDFGTVETVYNDATNVRRVVNYNGDITSYQANLKVEVSPAPLSANLKKFVATVYWKRANGTEASFTLITLKRNDDA